MNGFNEAIRDAVDSHGITAVATVCKTSRQVVRRWVEGFPPYGFAQASILEAVDTLDAP